MKKVPIWEKYTLTIREAAEYFHIGEKKMRPFYNPDGTFEVKECIDLGLTIDERIADGYYYSRTIQLLKTLLENPELLEKPLSEEVDF